MKPSPALPEKQDDNRRLLLVQCCHLPQFFYLAAVLRRQFPDTLLDALAIPSDDLDFYLSRQNPFSSVLTPSSPSSQETNYSRIFFPLLNRGYPSIKSAARQVSGPAFEIDYQGRWRPLSVVRLAGSVLYPLHQPDEAFREYFLSFPHRPLGEKVLFVESCHPSLVKATEPVWRPALPDPCELTRVVPQPFLKAIRQLRDRRFDSGIVFFSGEKGFSGIKLVPFLLRVPKILVVNESGDFFYATLPGLLRFLYQRVRFGPALPRPTPKILFIQTEVFSSCRFALTRLKSAELFPDSEIVVLCRKENSSTYRNVAGVDRVFELRKRGWRHNWHTFRQLRLMNPDIVSAVFSGRPVFGKAKFLFLLLCDRPGLVFNARLDAYWLKLRTLVFRREPLLFEDPAAAARNEILLIQTDASDTTLEVLERLLKGEAVGPGKVRLLCREEDRQHFLPWLEEKDISTWTPGISLDNLKLMMKLCRMNRDVVTAILSGRPVFRLPKLAFFLLPARYRLVFNENIDCFYLARSRFSSVLRLPSLPVSFHGSSSRWKHSLRQTARIALWLPRFAYLLGWLTVEKLRRARRLQGAGRSSLNRQP